MIRRRTLSIHTRLFLGFGAALAGCGALMVVIIYVGIRYLPTYDFSTTVSVPPSAATSHGPTPTHLPEFRPAHPVEGAKVASGGLIQDEQDVWHAVLAVSVAGVLLVTAVGLGAGWLLSRRLLRPLSAINRAAARAGQGELSFRINARGPADELKQLADTFDATLARLEESFEAQGRFAANASHELLTPLATTRAVLQVAAADPNGEEFAELLPMLVETNERNITVVEELLQLAASEQVAFDPEPVDVADLVAEAVDALRGRGGPDVRLRLPGDAADCLVAGNATLLRQSVVNLLDNARTHNTPDGSVDVAVVADEAAGAVVLDVSNTGPVVDPETVDRLFEPFYRARPRVSSDRGHGLGLALVRSVVRAHHGTVTAEAPAGGGLRVHVRLPAAVDG
ncbi:HAMP domain-containing histidine kinase [Streptomyces sp. SID14478]|uniref:sensor histidine kinase n=1 Tax=Streptomyces sp. SID14478 TaxID=2706073 RepID=UPI0013D98569|nr:HAMP domain-containing sensor histidine kinase [Streptomyces sp. SID14478]NEB74111.1 HAMP domain-containing histidine kinase [Streptomyces sp. SID14478]